VLHSFLRQNGLYLLPAVVHDYLYWKQTCTRDQSDQILLLGMIENKVPYVQRTARSALPGDSPGKPMHAIEQQAWFASYRHTDWT
jgi:Protein of unknown function (DUF1353)